MKFKRADKGNRVDSILYAIYDASLPFALGLAKIISLFNPKLRTTLRGKGARLKDWHFSASSELPVVLIHVASAGEFEGAKPLIDRLISSKKIRVAVSFSSPSAESSVAATAGLYAYGFLPHDFFVAQLRLIDRLQPEIVLIFKHDFWPNFLRGLSLLGIPVGLVNANFHKRSRRGLLMVNRFHRAFMKNLDFIWTVSEADRARIQPLVSTTTELEVGGDTRYDRVLLRAEEGRQSFKQLSDAFDGHPVIVAGSTWEPDEEILFQAFAKVRKTYPNLRLIVAPHEPEPAALRRNEDLAGQYGLHSTLYSDFVDGKIVEDVLIIDRTRILAGLYSVGWASYVGGGFGIGVHSVIEPAACSLPVMFGPNHHVSHEAGLLILAKGGFEVRDFEQISKLWLSWLDDNKAYNLTSQAAHKVVTSNAGAVERLLGKVESYLSLNLKE